ncbi:family 10 glycosylhydrolase [Paenibacillus sp. UMB7766-LJ446]|uniref:family 10 glycosylhydrolase n=1 Tax=Paenibacillus sp. UMB7766-LJ446 TaxID=3046313 RepID=UPI002550D8A4|nr:family 10 glycosylhydrolase [Paenibacillus sp. UMB7766-LJ446]MDK8192430.1 family 10 glycosylhydrolase [Paenibacillus sp. UMB7766-LJ446]
MKLRKGLILLLIFVLGLQTAGLTAQAASQKGIIIYLDGQRLESDVSPYILPKVNVTMVPLRVISEGLGASVLWSQATRTVTIKKSDSVITMTSGRQQATVDGAVVDLDASVELKQGRVMVPIRFVSENLGIQVTWNQSAQTIDLTTGNAPNPNPVTPAEPGGTGTTPSTDEMRGAWISTVNGDWPSSGAKGNVEKQKLEFIQQLDTLKDMGINAVFVQVRANGDAIYPSGLVPWNSVLTGTQGKDPGYDPLAFMVEEAHKRGLEFHAWFNPFRATNSASTTGLAVNHVSKLHPDWMVNASGKLYINPGIPEARQHIIDTIMEVVNQYDVDGVHLDDYFYPSNVTFNDDAAFKAYNTLNTSDRAEWRRDNINQFVKQLGESIHKVKAGVQYGISPFGVWRNKSVDMTGSDTKAGVTAYDSMNADVRTWIKQEWIDYVAPQVYWSMTLSAARYDKVVDWWANEVANTDVKLYIGHSPYKLGTPEIGWQTSQEIIDQLIYNEKYDTVKGDIFFSSQYLTKNPLGLIAKLKAYYGL